MSEFLSYDLQDFLLFSDATYWRLFERLNAAIWPFQILLIAIFNAVFYASLASDRTPRLLFGLLALSWFGVASGFASFYAEINWAMVYVTPVFWAYAIALGVFAIMAPIPSRSDARRRGGLQTLMGVAITAAALVLWPLAAIPLRGSLVSAEIVGSAADPTAVATLGVLLAFGRGWGAALLCLPPLIWCGLSALILVTMGASNEGFILAAIPILALAAFGTDATLRRRS